MSRFRFRILHNLRFAICDLQFAIQQRRIPAPMRTLQPRTPNPARQGFTLVELLVAIAIIGILAALALGGMYRATLAAKQTNSKTTVNKVAVQINEIWESYRTRKLPIDPQLVLQASTPGSQYYAQWCAATGSAGYAPGWLPYYTTVQSTTKGTSTLYSGVASPMNNLQVAALRLAATHELMRLEMPSTFNDFLTPVKTNPPDPDVTNNSTPVKTLLIPQPYGASGPLANPGGLSEQYRQFFIANAKTYNELYQNAECLYMIIKFASQNELGQKNITDDPRLVGDVDGDGMPEIQDAFNSGTFTAPPAGSAITQHNQPISFLRWPAGFLSDLQPGPTVEQYAQASTPALAYIEYAASRHEIFDPLQIDPRAFTLTPLVYSAGADGAYGLIDWWILYTKPSWPNGTADLFHLNDPYYQDPSASPPLQPLGTQINTSTSYGQWADNITNHQVSTRLQ